MKAVIIDDEPKARKLLAAIIDEYCPDILEYHLAEDLKEGIALLKTHQPEVVFLDIEMPENSGLEILNFLNEDEIIFEIIFTTAYNEFALRAFELSAVAYLLKPLRPSQVQHAVEKAKEQLNKANISRKLEELKSNLSSSNFKKIGLVHSKGIKFVAIEEIILMEASGMYTTVSIKNQKDVVVSKPLKYFADLLEEMPSFFRPHRSFLINLNYLTDFVRVDGNYLVLEDGKEVAIAKDKVDPFMKIVQKNL